ncbi:hypothetical protein BESB_066580 [Besnoitia besnoiti]|uniref:Uncharacterized protein n=1 Tax=Besnoitia besnoiti TaxID=94643 RepID=A0A2A9M9E3_BESBE|nr:hypothetical protein BESB_066580 [Besnoitia besnoiti]PFH34625.1 hypothetical protein BESB_066580 [Besnoitia besnoiti]
MSAYDTAIRGKLSLKGKGLPSNDKKKRKRRRDEEAREEEREMKREKLEKTNTEEEEQKTKKAANGEGERETQQHTPEEDAEEIDEDLLLLEEEQNPNWTPAEKAFRLAQKKREKERVNERLKFTHRQRMEKLNAHLASLSEHFDQPRVGPG